MKAIGPGIQQSCCQLAAQNECYAQRFTRQPDQGQETPYMQVSPAELLLFSIIECSGSGRHLRALDGVKDGEWKGGTAGLHAITV